MKARNLFTTKTMQGAFAMGIGFLVATAPLVNNFVDRKFPKAAEDIKFYIGLIVVGGGFLRTSYGRHQATKDVFTPESLPGRGEEEVISKK